MSAIFLSLVLKVVMVDLNQHRWFAYENAQLIRSGKAIGGRTKCIDQPKSCKTPEGIFNISRKYGYNKRSIKYPLGCCSQKGCKPRCSRMYYAMTFGNDGEALHGSDEINVNFNASHGCVRLNKDDAKWLNKNFVEIGTKIIVLPYGGILKHEHR
jgi:lipoprotein-anchoring transpeptidase ErfK/SrfK